MKVTWKSRLLKSICYLIVFAFLTTTRSFIVADEAKSSPPTNCPECQAKADELQKTETDLAAKRQSLADIYKTPEQIKDAESKLVQLKNLKQGGYVAPESKAQLDKDIAELEKNIEKYKDESLKQNLQKEIQELVVKRNARTQDLAECRKKCKETKQSPPNAPAQPEEPQPFQFIMPAPLPHEPVKADCPECKKIADEINELVGDEALLMKKYQDLQTVTDFWDQSRRQSTISQEEMEISEREYNSNNYYLELTRAQWYMTSWRINALLVDLEACHKKCTKTLTVTLPPDVLKPAVPAPAPSAPGTPTPGTPTPGAPGSGPGTQSAPGSSTQGTPSSPAGPAAPSAPASPTAPGKPASPPASQPLPPQPVPKPLGEPVTPIPVQPAPQQPGKEPPAQGPVKEKCPECQAKADELQKIVIELASLKQLIQDIDKGPEQIQNVELKIAREQNMRKYAAKEYLPKVDKDIEVLEKTLRILKRGNSAKPGLQKEISALETQMNKTLTELNECRKKCLEKEPPATPGGLESFPPMPFFYFPPIRHDPVKADCPECKAKADEINKLINEENKLIDEILKLEEMNEELEINRRAYAVEVAELDHQMQEQGRVFVVGRAEAYERLNTTEKKLKTNVSELIKARYDKSILSSRIDSLITELTECHKKCRKPTMAPLPPNAVPPANLGPGSPGTAAPAPAPASPPSQPGAPGVQPPKPVTTSSATPPSHAPETPGPSKPATPPGIPASTTPAPAPGIPGPSAPVAAKDCPECRKIAEELEKTRATYEDKKIKLKFSESMEAFYTKKILEITDELAERSGLLGYIKTSTPEWGGFLTVSDDLDRQKKEHIKSRTTTRDKMTALQSEINALSLKIDELTMKLEECREKCKPPAEPPQIAPAPVECPKIPFEPVIIGPKSKFGSGFAKMAQEMAGSIPEQMMSGAGGVENLPEPSSEKPPVVKNPFKQMTKFTDPETGTAIKVAAKQTDKGILIGVEIDKGKGKPTFHSITLHRDDCGMMLPTEYFLYELWLKWWLTVSWTKTTYVNNQMVKQEHGGWSAHGSELLDRGIFASNQGGEESIWRHFGFDRATEGPKAVGAEFATGGTGAGPAQKPPTKCVIHVTQPDKDPVKTLPFVFNILTNPDGTIKLTQVPNVMK